VSAKLTCREVLDRLSFATEAVELQEPKVALAILRDLEEDLRGKVARRQRHACPECGISFAHPGARDDHVRFVHGVELDGLT
jgi:hypothetical protein